VADSESEGQVLFDIEDSFDPDAYRRYVKASRLAGRALGIKGGETGVVINGRVSVYILHL
jgi:UDP-glucose:glycoprotein glucosyltransferase